jgi:hypothetical protein
MAEIHINRPILGTKLSNAQIETVNRLKGTEQALLEYLDELEPYIDMDPRWLAIGTSDIQTGFMALVRAITDPEGY